MITRQTSLSANIVQFCRYLRQKGFLLSADEQMSALAAMHFIECSNRDIFRQALKSVLCRSQEQVQQFDNLFFEYWNEIEKAIDSKEKRKTNAVFRQGQTDPLKSLKSWLHGNRNEETEQTASYSRGESLTQKDFSNVLGDEMVELSRIIRALAKRMAAQLHRRHQKSNKPKLPDLRKTLRKSMRHGGELVNIAFRKPKPNRVQLVILCDVSKSMDLYASFLLQFMFAFQHFYRRIETFAFSTALERITPLFKQNEFTTALHLLAGESNTWSGGTRIGESLDHFIQDFAPAFLDKRTIVIIVSDGWDTGNITLLRQSMEIIQRASKKVIWLNPLAGYSLYRPQVSGMQAAMPYIDVFAPVYNVDSLKKLVRWL